MKQISEPREAMYRPAVWNDNLRHFPLGSFPSPTIEPVVDISKIADQLWKRMFERPVMEPCEYCESWNIITNTNCVKCGAGAWRGQSAGLEKCNVPIAESKIEFPCPHSLIALGDSFSTCSRLSNHSFCGAHGKLIRRLMNPEFKFIYNPSVKHTSKVHLTIPQELLYQATLLTNNETDGSGNVNVAAQFIKKIWVNSTIEVLGPNAPWWISFTPPDEYNIIEEFYYSNGTIPA